MKKLQQAERSAGSPAQAKLDTGTALPTTKGSTQPSLPQKAKQLKQATFARPGVSTRSGDQRLAALMGQAPGPLAAGTGLQLPQAGGPPSISLQQLIAQDRGQGDSRIQQDIQPTKHFDVMAFLGKARVLQSPSLTDGARGYAHHSAGGDAVTASAVEVLQEVKKVNRYEPSSRHPVGFPNDSTMSEGDIGDIGHGLLLRQPTAIIVYPKDGGDPITLDPLQVQSLYLQLNGFNGSGDSLQQLLSQGRNPEGAWDSSMGLYSLEDLPKYQDAYRQQALDQLEELGLTEEQFYAVVNDAQVMRQELSLQGLEPYEFAAVEFHGYDLQAANSKKTGITDGTQVSMKQYDVSLHELGPLMDDAGQLYLERKLESTANYLKHHEGITDLDLSQLGETFNELWVDALTNAVETGKPPELATYAKLMQLKAAYEAGELPYEYEELLDVEKLDAQIAKYTDPTTPEGAVVAAHFEQTQEAARAESYEKIKDRVEDHKNYLMSDDFQERLALLPDAEQRAITVQLELAKLAALDPKAAQEVSAHLLAEQITSDPIEGIQNLSEEERTDALEEALRQLAAEEGLDIDDAALAEYAAELSTFFGEVPPGLTPEELLQYANKAASAGGALEKLANTPLFDALTKKGMQVLACAGLVVGLYQHGFKADTPMDVWKSVTSVTKLAAKLATTLGDIEALGKAGQSLGKVGKILGPIAGALAVPLDAYSLALDIKRGDVTGSVLKGVGMAAGLVSLTAGLLALGSTGVGAPVAAVAGLVALSAGFADAIFGEDDVAADTLKDLGVYKEN